VSDDTVVTFSDSVSDDTVVTFSDSVSDDTVVTFSDSVSDDTVVSVTDNVSVTENGTNVLVVSNRDISYKLNNNDLIWELILKVNNKNLSEDVVIITAAEIKSTEVKKKWTGKSSQFEPRNLCKMDCRENRPKIFKDNNLYMIAIKNGEYALIKESIYIDLPKCHCEPKHISNKCDSIVLTIGDSETSILNRLLCNGVLNEVIGEDIKYGPLLGGRLRCGRINMPIPISIGSIDLEIRGPQFETDGCYETDNYVCIVEAKSIKCTNFNVRQLYFPYRVVYDRVKDKKEIICLFTFKDDKTNIIHIYKYKWGNPDKMLDIIFIESYKYKIE
jgi:hypothetical protein